MTEIKADEGEATRAVTVKSITRARESVEHVLWEQLRWFDEYVKGADVGAR